MGTIGVLFALLAGLCLAAGAAEAAPDTAVLYGRLLGPRRHVTFVADVDILSADPRPSKAKLRCLSLSSDSPRFKYALPVDTELPAPQALGHRNCSNDAAVRSIINDLQLSPNAFQASACAAAAKMTRVLTQGSGYVADTKCTANSAAPGQGVLMEALQDGELVTASLQFLRVEAAAARAPRPLSAKFKRGGAKPGRGRRSHDEDQKALQDCIADSTKVVVPTDAGGDVVLMLGLTGGGKSTVVRLLTNQYDTLYSNKTSQNEFTIWDSGDKIGSGVESKTTIPELVSDPLSLAKVYDFPGFSDTRGPCGDIVTASVLRKVAQSASNVKVVFVIPYHSVYKGGDRVGFVELLRHATVFMPALYKYTNSVALIVSKVPHIARKDKVDGKRKTVKDAEMRETVALFLREVIAALGDMSKTDAKGSSFYPAATALVRALLQRDPATGDYGRIGVFRRPTKEGRLVDMVLMQRTSSDLQAMVYNTLTPTAPETGDFGLPLSAEAQQVVVKMSGNFAGRLRNHVERIARALRAHYQSQRRRSLDLDAVRDATADAASHLEASLASLTTPDGSDAPRAFLGRLRDLVLDVHRSAPTDAFRAALDDTKLLEFLQDASEEKLPYNPQQWAQPLTLLLKDLQRVALWYHVLDDLDMALSEPSFQPNGRKLLTELIEDSTRAENEYTASVSEDRSSDDGALLMLAVMEKLNVTAMSHEISEVQPDEQMSLDLRLLLDSAVLPQPLQSTCELDDYGQRASLVLRGHNVWMQDVVKRLKEGCKYKVSAVHVLAERALVVDESLYLHDLETVAAPATLVAVAPSWHVEGRRVLSVDGVAGQAHNQSLPDYSGRHGSAGRPGGTAGNILAVGADFVNGRQLTLRASGGRGGPGQDGASGRNGADGWNPDVAQEYSDSWGLPPLWGGQEGRGEGSFAAVGNNGGDGGVGGQGGRAGSIRVLRLGGTDDAQALPAVVRSSGGQGSKGTGGKGGKGGEHGYTMHEKKDYFLFFPYRTKKWTEAIGQAEDGKYGEDGASRLQETQPREPQDLDCTELYLRRVYEVALGTISDRIRGGAARSFLRQLEDSLQPTASTSSCGLTALAHYVADLEVARWRHRQDYGSSQRLVPLYEASLHRLDAVARLLTSPTTRKQKAVYTLRSALLSSLRALRAPARSQLVVDVREYLRASERAVQQLDEGHRVQAVASALRDARAGLAARLRERRALLLEHVQPALDAALRRLQDSVRALPSEMHLEQQRLAADQREVVEHARLVREAKFRTRVLKLVTGVFSSLLTGFSTGEDVVETVAESTAKALTTNPSGEEFGMKDVLVMASSALTALDDGDQKNNATETGSSGLLSSIGKIIKSVGSKIQKKLLRNQQNATLQSSGTGDGALLVALKEHALQKREAALQAAERAVHTRLLPVLRTMQRDLDGVPRNSTGFARTLQSRLADVRVALTPLTTSAGPLGVPREIAACVDLVHESLGALISLQDQMAELRERGDMAVAMGRMAWALASPGGRDDWQEDPDPHDLTAALHRLQETVSSNLVLEEYHLALHNFKQWAFPFVMEYQLDEHVPDGNYTFQSAVDRAKTGLSALLSKLQKYHAVVRGHDQYISTSYFQDPKPLYSWGPTEHRAELDGLLKGQEVLLWADVLQSPDQHDAIKFNTIGVRLLTLNESRQAELDEALGPLSVRMTHLGESYFKCGSKVFVLSLQSQEISFSMKRDQHGVPAETNMVYKKIKEGDMMLSPFALWKISLDRLTPATLQTLSSMEGEVRLVLEGNVQYVTKYECNNMLDEFYSFDQSKTALSTLVI